MGSKLSNLREVYRNRTENMERRLPDDQKHCANSENSNKRNYQVSLLLDVNGNPQNCIINTDEDDGDQYSQNIFDSNAGNTLTDDKRFLPTLMATTYKIMNDPVALGQPVDSKLNNTDKSAKSSKVGKKKSRSRLFFLTKDVSNKKKKNHWVLKFGCTRLKCGSASNRSNVNKGNCSQNISCVCTGYKRTEPFIVGVEMSSDDLSLVPLLQDNDDDDDVEDEERTEIISRGEFVEYRNSANGTAGTSADGSGKSEPVIDLSKFNPEDYPTEDCDERARLERAREIAEGVDPPPGFSSKHHIEVACPSDLSLDNLTAIFCSALSLSTLSQIDTPVPIHTQVDYIHCLVPDLLQITSCSFYWGKMDRYEAERLLENKPEGTFLLRDSAQEEYLFSVSFRKYGSSLHARIEQWNHRFSFDSHDPGVFASSTVCGLIEHYKDPTCCMFFEPMLTIPLHRIFPFSLQHLCRAVICNSITYDSVNLLELPKSLKSYLKEYHYKQRVRVRKFDTDH